MRSLAIALSLTAALVGAASPVFARHSLDQSVTTTIALLDGSTLYNFKDGKMAKEDAYGRATSFKRDEILRAKDGRQIKVVGNESARLDRLLNEDHR